MPDSLDEIIDQARELGRKIAAHPRTKDFLAAARAVAEDRQAQDLLKTYQEAVNKIRTLQSAGKPIEPEDKRKVADAERGVAGDEKLKAMMKHQADYMELMQRVNGAIDQASQSEGGS